MQSLTEATEQWRTRKAEMESCYETYIDKRMAVQEASSQYARMMALAAESKAKADYDSARNAAVEARMALDGLKHGLVGRS